MTYCAIFVLFAAFIIGPSLFFAIQLHYMCKVRVFVKTAKVLPQKTEITYREFVNNII